MKKILALIVLTALLFSCEKPKGSLSGNAYYKFNNYVGNKPNAGTDIYLFSEDTSKQVLKATTDVAGNFEINDIETGDYKLLALSKSVNGSAIDTYSELKIVGYENKYGGFSFIDIDSTLSHKCFSYYLLRDKYLLGPSPFAKQADKIKYFDSAVLVERNANHFADSLIKKIPENSRLLRNVTVLGAGIYKIKTFSIKIEKNKKANQVIDFGLNYR